MHTFVTVRTLVLNDKGQALLLRRPLHDYNRPGQWDFPGGKLEPDEDLTEAAKRETLEESGIVARDPKLVWATSEVRNQAGGTWLFFLDQYPDTPRVTISDEHTEYRWLPLDDVSKEITYYQHLNFLRYVIDHKLAA
jgi:8-oxo-dGTP diphosphatase